MANTILQEDRVLISKVFNEVHRGDIVSFKYPKDHSIEYVKRIVGLPNEKIEIKNNKVFINGKELAEQVLYVKPELKDNNQFDLTIPLKVIGRQKVINNPLYAIYLQDTKEKDITELMINGQKYSITEPFLIPQDS